VSGSTFACGATALADAAMLKLLRAFGVQL
jgi:hypothetical protein